MIQRLIPLTLLTDPVKLEHHVTRPPTEHEKDKDQSLSNKYFMVVPSFGPNNQYMSTKESTVLAQILGRNIVRPVYIAHLVKGEKGPRPFEKTWNTSNLDSFLDTFSSSPGFILRGPTKDKVCLPYSILLEDTINFL
jgi:hypothetical protein